MASKKKEERPVTGEALFGELTPRLMAGQHCVVHGGYDLDTPICRGLRAAGVRAAKIGFDWIGQATLRAVCFNALALAVEDIWADLSEETYDGFGEAEPMRLFSGLVELAGGAPLSVVVTDLLLPNRLSGSPLGRGIPGPDTRLTDLDPAQTLGRMIGSVARVTDELVVAAIYAACQAAMADRNLTFCIITDEERQR